MTVAGECLANSEVMGIAFSVRDLKQIGGDSPAIVFAESFGNIMARRPFLRRVKRFRVLQERLHPG